MLAWVAYGAGGLAIVALVVTAVVGGRRRAIRRDVLLAVGVTVGLAVVAGRAAVGEWPTVVPEVVDPGDVISYPVLRLTLLVAVLATAAPHLTAPTRTAGRRVLGASAVGGVVLGLASVSGLVGGLALGRGVAATIHLVFGSPAGLPSTERLVAALARLGFPDADVEILPRQPVGVTLVRANMPGGDRLLVKVYGRDAADTQLAAKLWRSIWYRDGGPTLSLTGLQQAEHEAVASLLAEGRGLSVSPILTVGQDIDENAFLIIEWPTECPIDELDDDLLTDRVIDQSWESLRALHAEGIAHGAIAPESLLVGDDHVMLWDLSDASLAAVDRRIQGDVAAMLASHIVVVGVERAVGGAVRNLEPDRLEAALPYMQDAVLRPDLRRRVKRIAKLSGITDLLLERVDVATPEMAQLRRVKPGDLLLVVFGILAANAIVSQVAEIGLDTLVDQVSDASVGFLVTTFAIALAGYYGDVVSIRAAVGGPVPLAPAALLQSAKRFIGLAVPSMAGRVALDVRFLQKLGIPAGTALAQGPLIGFIGFLAEVLILALCAWSVGQDVDLDVLGNGNAGWILVGVSAIVVVGAIVLFAVPRLRAIVLPPLREAMGAAADVVGHPRRIGRIFAGQLFDRALSGLALAATLAAFDVRISFASVLFVAIGTGLIQGLAPVPGGIGVAEATMTALLSGVGVDPEVAFAVAITHRVITSYLPPVLGWFSFRWLTDNGYL